MSAASTEACPTPLAWHEVLAAFRAESRPWQIAGRWGTVTGRTWGAAPPLYFLPGWLGDAELFALTGWVLNVIYDKITDND